LILAEEGRVTAAHLDLREPGAAPRGTLPLNLEDLERDAITRALEASEGNRRVAAERLGIGLRTLYEKLKRYGIE
jgi:two-component system response regulator FlrC